MLTPDKSQNLPWLAGITAVMCSPILLTHPLQSLCQLTQYTECQAPTQDDV